MTLLVIAFAGCGGSNQDVAPVHGRVTLDGQPLPYASVVFESAGKSPSGGYTDQDGNYQLIFKRGVNGAPVGVNHVTILEDIQRTRRPQRVPARYNQNSDLEREVKSGDNNFDFDLTSEGK